MFKLDWEKAGEPEIKLPTFIGSQRKLGNSRKTSTSVSSTVPKPLTLWIIINCGKLLKRWEYKTTLPAFWETCMWVKKQKSEPCMKQLIGSRLRREYNRAVCCHPVCLTYTLSTEECWAGWLTSWNQDRWEKHQQLQICGWYHSNGKKQRGT